MLKQYFHDASETSEGIIYQFDVLIGLIWQMENPNGFEWVYCWNQDLMTGTMLHLLSLVHIGRWVHRLVSKTKWNFIWDYGRISQFNNLKAKEGFKWYLFNLALHLKGLKSENCIRRYSWCSSFAFISNGNIPVKKNQ